MKLNIRILLYCVTTLLISPLYAKTGTDHHLKVSYIIPCYWGHFKHLQGLLDVLCKQTVLPDEVVISLSEIQKLDDADVQKLESQILPFRLLIIKHTEKLSTGANRNCACENASGDICILNDADDLPHVQRIEFIRDVFEQTDAQMVMHDFDFSFDIFEKYEPIEIRYQKLLHRPVYCSYAGIEFRNGMHHGNVSIRRLAIEKVKWPSEHRQGEDITFCLNFYEVIGNIYCVNFVLILYRNKLSSW